MVLTTLVISQLIAGAIAALPFVYHRLRVGYWAKNSPLALPLAEFNDLPTMTVVIPTWNEELLIHEKLSALASQEYPRDKLEIIVIDSASTDDTLNIVRTWYLDNKNRFLNFSIIEMANRLGKTAAVKQAFATAGPSSEILVITDVDARLDQGSFKRLGAWFSDPEIGAVGATPKRFSNSEEMHSKTEISYRDMFTIQRIGESARDSTPFLEGSLLGIRRSAYSESALDTGSNADDAQLAVATRIAGFRAIQDGEMIFREPIPPTYHEFREQKVRRGQGLQRLLWRYRRHWFSRRQGAWGNILGMQAIMHIMIPWVVLIGSVFAVVKWCMIIGSPPELSPLVTATLILDTWIFGSWLLFRIRIKLPLMTLPATFIDSMISLLISQFKLLSGESMHLWNQGLGVRQSWLEVENQPD